MVERSQVTSEIPRMYLHSVCSGTTWHLGFNVRDCDNIIVHYSLGLVIHVASTRPGTRGFHANLPTSGGGGARQHCHPGVELHLVVVESGVGVELDRATWRQYRYRY